MCVCCLTWLAGGAHSPHISHAVHITQLKTVYLREQEERRGEERIQQEKERRSVEWRRMEEEWREENGRGVR
jgi:hypothetical protein